MFGENAPARRATLRALMTLCGFLYRNLKPGVRSYKMMSHHAVDATDWNTNKFFRPPAKNSGEPLENIWCDAPSINHVTAAFSPFLQESPDFVDLHHFEISDRRIHDRGPYRTYKVALINESALSCTRVLSQRRASTGFVPSRTQSPLWENHLKPHTCSKTNSDRFRLIADITFDV